MFLSDNEKRDVIKYLEAGKPLPDKYRFLLFEGDREVELVWNGKTSEITNVVLPFQTIEQIDEPRSDAKFISQGSLIDFSGRQIAGWTNKLIWGDNKLILSSLKNGPLRKEIVAELDKNGNVVERWTGDYIFDNEWQSFRTKKNRNLELISASKEVAKGVYKVAVKVVDIFGNDTTKVIEVTI